MVSAWWERNGGRICRNGISEEAVKMEGIENMITR